MIRGDGHPAHHLCDLFQCDLVVAWVLLGQSPREKKACEPQHTSLVDLPYLAGLPQPLTPAYCRYPEALLLSASLVPPLLY